MSTERQPKVQREPVSEFFCPYCKLWITDLVHREDHHNDIDEPDEFRVKQRRTRKE